MMRRVFVYGSLRRGFSNHRFLESASYLGEATTAPHYRLVSLGAFPGMTPGLSVVRGEVYEVDADTLRRLDALEGHPHFYRRERVALDGFPGACEAYVLPNAKAVQFPTVWTGDWANAVTADGPLEEYVDED